MPDISTLTFPALYDDEGPPRCLTPEPIAPDTPRFTLRNWVTRGTERTLLDRLPVEMITYIRSFIPHGYLFTHLAFYWSCDFVNSIYKKDDRFWSKVCTAYGIGKPLDHPLATFTWRELAITIAEHQVQCFETTCWGQVEIDRHNWHQVEVARNSFRCIIAPKRVQSTHQHVPGFVMDIGLRDGCPCNPGTCDCQDDAGMQLWSREHPAAVCLFATEIPVMQLNVQVFDVFTIKVSNPDGVTVWDVMNEMRRAMEHEFITVKTLYKVFRLPDLSHMSRRFDALHLFRLRDLLPYLPLTDNYRLQQSARIDLLLQKLEVLERPAGVDMDTPVLQVLPLRFKITRVLSCLSSEFIDFSDSDWFQHMREFETVASTFNTLHAKLTGIHQYKSNSITYHSTWYFPLRQDAWVRFLTTWPDEWMNYGA